MKKIILNEYPCLYLKNPLNLLNYNKLLRQTKLFVSCYLSGKYIYLRYICEHSLILSIIAILSVVAMDAQNNKTIEQRIMELEDRVALKNLVDTFSNLSDTKEAELQAQLFTEDATVKTLINGKVSVELKGRKQIAEVFGNFLAKQETIYHINGQQTVTLNGNRATGISYCQVAMIAKVDSKRTITQQGVRYDDEYQKIDGRWYIKNRISNFMWRDTRELNK
ncbi:nuclear transport factor 2 family protein [Tannerella forsythia]|uniref:nuclear transport factor 2 family protein n=1 Tax=Tannerella forsythia TaxID=28112 RepID=UPI00211D57FA|nr:nuclear transport factor 2 family protein [Tannerella forsythia]